MRHSRKLVAGMAVLLTLSLGGAAVADTTSATSTTHRTRADACIDAKERAELKAGYQAKIQRYGQCECDQNRDGRWVCNVDVYYTRD